VERNQDERQSPPLLLLITESYPYGLAAEDTFLEPELPYLLDVFERVVLVPLRTEGARASLDARVEVDETLAVVMSSVDSPSRMIANALRSGVVWNDIRQRPRTLVQLGALRLLIATAARAEISRGWLSKRAQAVQRHGTKLIAYTFWCNYAAAGIALTRGASPSLVGISRAHGADLYAERHDPPYLPLRRFVYSNLNAILPDSDRGRIYLVDRYSDLSHKFRLARMGTRDPNFTSRPSSHGRVVVVSCSALVAVKRVDLIATAVASAARRRPDVVFEWHHFGGGPLLDDVHQVAQSVMPDNARANMHGLSRAERILDFYRSSPVDVFINASLSEGTPVSIMEAASCGIPIVATAVGGNVEIVSEDNGFLVPRDSSADQIGDAILSATSAGHESVKRRSASRSLWARQYDAATNYPEFAALLLALAESRP
jgi:glycosyltransferase involved in cell wall biosynthesis